MNMVQKNWKSHNYHDTDTILHKYMVPILAKVPVECQSNTDFLRNSKSALILNFKTFQLFFTTALISLTEKYQKMSSLKKGV